MDLSVALRLWFVAGVLVIAAGALAAMMIAGWLAGRGDGSRSSGWSVRGGQRLAGTGLSRDALRKAASGSPGRP